MSTVDMSGIAGSVSDIQIDGPTIDIPPVENATGAVAPSTPADAPPAPTEAEIAAATPSGKTVELFDSGRYLEAVVVDGQKTDEIVVAFSGSIRYDAMTPEGREMFERLTLGRSVSLRIEGIVAGKAGSYKLAGVGTDDEREVVTGKATVKVTDLYRLTPEEL